MGFPPIELPEDDDDRKARLKRAGEEEEGSVDFVQYHHLRTTIADALLRVAALADAGDRKELAADFRAIEQSVPRLLGARWHKLYVAIGFWDCWIAEAERGFPSNFLLARDRWAPLARVLAADLHADRDVTDAQILAVADLSNTVNLIRTYRRP